LGVFASSPRPPSRTDLRGPLRPERPICRP
jgi:hypothetical protein